MTRTLRIKDYIPIVCLIGLLILLGYELFYQKTNAIPSSLIGEPLPSFQLPDLLQSDRFLTNKELTGKVILLNVWASWCHACVLEHPMLMKINRDYHVPIYGIIYKDDATIAKQLLAYRGNPFVKIGEDRTGRISIDLGIYGTPESFIISREGRIVYRYIGTITESNWTNVIYPMIKHYGG